MQRQGTTWHGLSVLAILASCGLGTFAGAGGDKKASPKPVSPKLVKAWRDAGAIEDQSGGVPAFQFSSWKQGVLAKLPDPGVAFANIARKL